MKKTLLIPFLSLLMLPLAAFGAANGVGNFHEVNFGGTTSTDTWIAIRKSNADIWQPGGSWGSHQSIPPMTYWTTPLLSNAGTGSSNIYRIANGDGGGAPYLASQSLYFGGIGEEPIFGGTVGIQVANPLADLRTIGLQIQINDAHGIDFAEGIKPQLYLNGNFSDSLSADHVVLVASVLVSGGRGPSNNNYYYLQWNIDPEIVVDNFEIRFSAIEHVQVPNIRLDQSDEALEVAAIPEPSTWSMIAICAVGGVLYLRRRQRKALAA